MRSLLLPTLLALLACTEPARSARDGSVAVPDCDAEPNADECSPYSAQTAMFTWAKALCGLLHDCCTTPDRSRTLALMVGEANVGLVLMREPALLEDKKACQRGLAMALFLQHQGNYESWDQDRQGFDRAAAEECLSFYQQGAAACAPGLVLLDEDHQPHACDRLFTPLIPSDGGCYHDDDCIAPPDGGRSVCQSRSELLDDGGVFFATLGRCSPLPELGGWCPLPGGDCGETAFCAADNQCRPRAQLDEPCLAAPCDEQTFCDTAAQPVAKCVPRRPSFGPCARDLECVAEAACDTELLMCFEVPDVSPLDVTFDFCLGDEGGTPVARVLVPEDAGIP